MSFAQGTSVPVERSRAEIENLLRKYGADQFASGWNTQEARIQFRAKQRAVRFILPMPDPTDEAITHYIVGRTHKRKVRRSDSETAKRYDQEVRRRWRALALVIKAKLEAVDTGITSFEEEFMPHIVMPDGKTVAEHVMPWIGVAYQKQDVPALPGW